MQQRGIGNHRETDKNRENSGKYKKSGTENHFLTDTPTAVVMYDHAKRHQNPLHRMYIQLSRTIIEL